MDFDKTSISMEYIEGISQKFNVESAGISTIYENGYEYHYRYFICKALVIGKVNIEPLEIEAEGEKIKTNQWDFKIIN